MLDDWKIRFEYEKYDAITGGYPDFYIVDMEIYIEIHPDCWTPKSLPDNAILLIDTRHFLPVVAALSVAIHGNESLNSKASKRLILSMERAIEYLRIVTGDGFVADYSGIRKIGYLAGKENGRTRSVNYVCENYSQQQSFCEYASMQVSDVEYICDLLGEL